MAKYRVINQSVEIGGKVRSIGEVLDESEFRPIDPNRDPNLPREQSEIHSLLATLHIALVE